MYADDTKIVRKISTQCDALILQNDIDHLQDWSKTWLLKFHPDKCHVLTLECYKHLRCYDKASLPDVFQLKVRPGRKHNLELQRKFPKDGIRSQQSNSFYYHVETQWNNLPSEVVNAKNTNTFKNELDRHWKNHPLRFEYTDVG